MLSNTISIISTWTVTILDIFKPAAVTATATAHAVKYTLPKPTSY